MERRVNNQKVIYLITLYEEVDGGSFGWEWFGPIPQRCFTTEQAAKDWSLDRHPQGLEGFEYKCPESGAKSWRCYWIEPIVLEEE